MCHSLPLPISKFKDNNAYWSKTAASYFFLRQRIYSKGNPNTVNYYINNELKNQGISDSKANLEDLINSDVEPRKIVIFLEVDNFIFIMNTSLYILLFN